MNVGIKLLNCIEIDHYIRGPTSPTGSQNHGAFIRTREFRISQFTTCEERSLEAEVQINMGNIP